MAICFIEHLIPSPYVRLLEDVVAAMGDRLEINDHLVGLTEAFLHVFGAGLIAVAHAIGTEETKQVFSGSLLEGHRQLVAWIKDSLCQQRGMEGPIFFAESRPDENSVSAPPKLLVTFQDNALGGIEVLVDGTPKYNSPTSQKRTLITLALFRNSEGFSAREFCKVYFGTDNSNPSQRFNDLLQAADLLPYRVKDGKNSFPHLNFSMPPTGPEKLETFIKSRWNEEVQAMVREAGRWKDPLVKR